MFEEGDSGLEEILVKGYGIRKVQSGCRCNCHDGSYPRPMLRVRRENAKDQIQGESENAGKESRSIRSEEPPQEESETG